jgi:hypothetical protein
MMSDIKESTVLGMVSFDQVRESYHAFYIMSHFTSLNVELDGDATLLCYSIQVILIGRSHDSCHASSPFITVTCHLSM